MGNDKYGAQRGLFERNKKIILATQKICILCGKPVDFTKKAPDFFSPSIDHFVPFSRGGDNSLDNLYLAHLGCNIAKGNKTVSKDSAADQKHRKITIANRNLPQSCDWSKVV